MKKVLALHWEGASWLITFFFLQQLWQTVFKNPLTESFQSRPQLTKSPCVRQNPNPNQTPKRPEKIMELYQILLNRRCGLQE